MQATMLTPHQIAQVMLCKPARGPLFVVEFEGDDGQAGSVGAFDLVAAHVVAQSVSLSLGIPGVTIRLAEKADLPLIATAHLNFYGKQVLAGVPDDTPIATLPIPQKKQVAPVKLVRRDAYVVRWLRVQLRRLWRWIVAPQSFDPDINVLEAWASREGRAE